MDDEHENWTAGCAEIAATIGYVARLLLGIAAVGCALLAWKLFF